jgi:hypothetical protein
MKLKVILGMLRVEGKLEQPPRPADTPPYQEGSDKREWNKKIKKRNKLKKYTKTNLVHNFTSYNKLNTNLNFNRLLPCFRGAVRRTEGFTQPPLFLT